MTKSEQEKPTLLEDQTPPELSQSKRSRTRVRTRTPSKAEHSTRPARNHSKAQTATQIPAPAPVPASASEPVEFVRPDVEPCMSGEKIELASLEYDTRTRMPWWWHVIFWGLVIGILSWIAWELTN